MVVGASFVDLAIILIDASKGVLLQTKRHVRIYSLMGICHFVFAVNKIDIIQYDIHKFKSISREIKRLMSEFTYISMQIIPVSATEGDNVTVCSKHIFCIPASRC